MSKHALTLCTALCVFLASPLALAESDHTKHKSHASHWSYSGDTGPKHWGDLDGKYKTCKTGKLQSPIDVKESIHAILRTLKIDYKPAAINLINNGHTIQVNMPKGSTMTVDNTTYNLLQFHFHTPSENTINGKRYDMELHFVHKTNDGQLGVLGVMIEEGKENAEAEKIWSHLPMQQGNEETFANVTINEVNLLPKNLNYYRLSGSLTTPPCSEGVNWHILKTPIEFSKDQIDKFKSAFTMNARPIQPKNNRLVVLDK